MTPIEVAVGVVRDAHGSVLLARRPDPVHQGGLWEFPGGKLEAGEAVEHALARELEEELGIRVKSSEPLIRLVHRYPGRTVRLHVRRVMEFEGMPSGCEGQPLVWVSPTGLHQYPMPEADRPILTALQLPDAYLITGEDPGSPEAFLQRLERALDAGVRLVQMRANRLDDTSYEALARRVSSCCREWGASLMIKGPVSRLQRIEADGLHLTAAQLMALARRPGGTRYRVSASCHDLAQLRQAETLQLDFAVLSPVRPTNSHPGAPALGWERFEQLVDRVSLPVYALGGLSLEHRVVARRHGAQGIAAIRGLWE